MKYLLYLFEGDVKKFPLNEKSVYILGRSTECDIVINNEFISRKHLKISIRSDSIEFFDLNSTNGIELNAKKVLSGKIKSGEFFSIKNMEFYLKNGTPDDLLISENLSTKNNQNFQRLKKLDEDTNYISGNIFNVSLKKILETGMKSGSAEMFFLAINRYITPLFEGNSLYLLERSANKAKLLNTFNGSVPNSRIDPVKLANKFSIFEKDQFMTKISEKLFLSSVHRIDKLNIAFILLSGNKIKEIQLNFLKKVLKIIELISDMMPKNHKRREKRVEKESRESSIISINKDIRNIIKKIKKLSKSDIFIHISGESGVGKELFTRMIHDNSRRKDKKFIALNCAAIPDTLLESELFGHEKGAFTDATSQKKGKLELSSGGTLFLDEIGEMNINLQAKLLRAIQEETFYRLGGTEPIKVDLRIITSTNRDLLELIKEGKFREDLYYRLVHVSMNIPPLRERKEDIIPLINHFTEIFARKLNKRIRGYSIKATNTLSEYEWPGNIRELKNEIYKLVNLVDEDSLIDFDLLSKRIQMFSHEMSTTIKLNGIKEKIGSYEKENIIKILNKHKWNKTLSAKELGMSYNTLFRKLKKYEIKN